MSRATGSVSTDVDVNTRFFNALRDKFPFHSGVTIKEMGVMTLTPDTILLPWSTIFQDQQPICIFKPNHGWYEVTIDPDQLEAVIRQIHALEPMLISTVDMDFATLYGNFQFFNLPLAQLSILLTDSEDKLEVLQHEFSLKRFGLVHALGWIRSVSYLIDQYPDLAQKLLNPIGHFLLRCIHFISNHVKEVVVLEQLMAVLVDALVKYKHIIPKSNIELSVLAARLLMEHKIILADRLSSYPVFENASVIVRARLIVEKENDCSVVVGKLPAHAIVARTALREAMLLKACEALTYIIRQYGGLDLKKEPFFYLQDLLRVAGVLNNLNTLSNDFADDKRAQQHIQRHIPVLYLQLQRMIVGLFQWVDDDDKGVLLEISAIILPCLLQMRCVDSTAEDVQAVVHLFSQIYMNKSKKFEYEVTMPLGQSKSLNFSKVNIFYVLLNSNSVEVVAGVLQALREVNLLKALVQKKSSVMEYKGKPFVKALDDVLVLLDESQEDKSLFQAKLTVLVENLLLMPDFEKLLGKIFNKFKDVLVGCVDQVVSIIIKKLEGGEKGAQALFDGLCQLLRQKSGDVCVPPQLTAFLHDNYQKEWPFLAYIDRQSGRVITDNQLRKMPLVKCFTDQLFELCVDKVKRCLVLDGARFRRIKFKTGLDMPGVPTIYLVSLEEMLAELQVLCPGTELRSDRVFEIPLEQIVGQAQSKIWTEEGLWAQSECKQRVDRLRELQEWRPALQERIAARQIKTQHLATLLSRFTYKYCLSVSVSDVEQAIAQHDRMIQRLIDEKSKHTFCVKGKDGQPVKITYNAAGGDPNGLGGLAKVPSANSGGCVVDEADFFSSFGGDDKEPVREELGPSRSRFMGFFKPEEGGAADAEKVEGSMGCSA